MTKLKHKIIPLILTFIIIFCSFESYNCTQSVSLWGVNPSDDYSYILEVSNWIVGIGGLSQSGEGGTFNNIHINDKTAFTVQVIAVDDIWGVDFRVDNATHNAEDSITADRFYYEFLNFIYYPDEECKRIINVGFNEEVIKLGPEIIHWFFIPLSQDTWDFFQDLSSVAFHNSFPRADNISGNFNAEFEKVDSQIRFDLLLKGTIKNQEGNTNILFDHSLQFVWNETTGVLLGYRIETYINGSYQGYKLSERLTIICRQAGYKLPRFKYSVGLIPGYSITIALVGLSVILIINILIHHKKR